MIESQNILIIYITEKECFNRCIMENEGDGERERLETKGGREDAEVFRTKITHKKCVL